MGPTPRMRPGVLGYHVIIASSMQRFPFALVGGARVGSGERSFVAPSYTLISLFPIPEGQEH